MMLTEGWSEDELKEASTFDYVIVALVADGPCGHRGDHRECDRHIGHGQRTGTDGLCGERDSAHPIKGLAEFELCRLIDCDLAILDVSGPTDRAHSRKSFLSDNGCFSCISLQLRECARMGTKVFLLVGGKIHCASIAARASDVSTWET